MSKRIEEILEVVEAVRERFQNDPDERSIRNLRIQALYLVADRRGIQSTTVSDQFRRRLRPEVDGIPEFDRLLEDWLVRDSNELRDILLKHKIDPGDVQLINNAFVNASELDILLAQEFGYDPNDVAFKEGKVHLHLHQKRDRSGALVVHAKAKWNQEQDGQVCCEVCGFSFHRTYGEIGKGFIEAHHILPISSLAADTRNSVADLVPVCSNCHSIIHHERPWLTVDDLRKIVSRHRDLGSA